jgi:hypothetical protein
LKLTESPTILRGQSDKIRKILTVIVTSGKKVVLKEEVVQSEPIGCSSPKDDQSTLNDKSAPSADEKTEEKKPSPVEVVSLKDPSLQYLSSEELLALLPVVHISPFRSKNSNTRRRRKNKKPVTKQDYRSRLTDKYKQTIRKCATEVG